MSLCWATCINGIACSLSKHEEGACQLESALAHLRTGSNKVLGLPLSMLSEAMDTFLCGFFQVQQAQP